MAYKDSDYHFDYIKSSISLPNQPIITFPDNMTGVNVVKNVISYRNLNFSVLTVRCKSKYCHFCAEADYSKLLDAMYAHDREVAEYLFRNCMNNEMLNRFWAHAIKGYIDSKNMYDFSYEYALGDYKGGYDSPERTPRENYLRLLFSLVSSRDDTDKIYFVQNVEAFLDCVHRFNPENIETWRAKQREQKERERAEREAREKEKARIAEEKKREEEKKALVRLEIGYRATCDKIKAKLGEHFERKADALTEYRATVLEKLKNVRDDRFFLKSLSSTIEGEAKEVEQERNAQVTVNTKLQNQQDPFAKQYLDYLADKECVIAEALDAFISDHFLHKFGEIESLKLHILMQIKRANYVSLKNLLGMYRDKQKEVTQFKSWFQKLDKQPTAFNAYQTLFELAECLVKMSLNKMAQSQNLWELNSSSA